MRTTEPPVAHGWRSLPSTLRGTAAWSAAALLIAAVVYLVVQFALTLGALVLTLLAALLLTALLRPLVNRLHRVGLPRLAATWLVLLVAVAATAVVVVFIEQQLVAQLPALRAALSGGLDRLRDLLVQQLGIPPERAGRVIAAVQNQVVGSGTMPPIVNGARTVLTVLGALALAVFTAFWLVYDGDRVWAFLSRLVPERWQNHTTSAGEAAWSTLGGYLRGVTLVALVDAIGIGAALLILDVPLPFTLALLTFLGGYIPLVGAALAGLAAVLVAFAAQGPTTALLTLGAVIIVQQLEGQVLQPLIMGRALQLHPLAIAWALSVGGLLWGIAGAIIAVPLAAVVYSVGSALAGVTPPTQPGPVRPGRLRLGQCPARAADPAAHVVGDVVGTGERHHVPGSLQRDQLSVRKRVSQLARLARRYFWVPVAVQDKTWDRHVRGVPQAVVTDAGERRSGERLPPSAGEVAPHLPHGGQRVPGGEGHTARHPVGDRVEPTQPLSDECPSSQPVEPGPAQTSGQRVGHATRR